MARDNWDPELEVKFGTQVAELLRPFMEQLRSTLPPGTHFGILVEIPPSVAGEDGRALVMATDRQRIGLAAAQWIMHAKPFGP